jgi:serine/threonine-protein kinase
VSSTSSPSSSSIPYQAGDVIDSKYRVVEVLGSGGMGIVLGCKHIALDSDVALKVLLPKFQKNGVLRERFLREARSAAQLRSSHVTKILDVGTDTSGAPYIVMERLRGVDLETLVKRQGVIEEKQAINLVLQACEALAEAHTEGIIHRDLKPENLFLVSEGREGRVKVLDFGISKVIHDQRALTGTAEVMGTPHFMSPEQFKSARDVTARTDVWALGAVLYRLLTGALPFESNEYVELLTRIMREPPIPIEQRRPSLSRGMCELVRRCLEKDPMARFANAHELRTALRAVREAQSDRIALAATVSMEAPLMKPVGPTLLPPKKRRPLRYALAALLVAAAAAGFTQRSAAMNALRPAHLSPDEVSSTITPLEAPASTAALSVEPAKTARTHEKARRSPH